jgi:peptidoglycan/LPS O-acetylase OafA/YrhL
MATRIPAKFRDTPATRQPVGPVHLFALAVGASAIVAAYAGRAISPDALLPVVCAALFVSAAILAAVGWQQRTAKPAFVTYWDVSGALTLIGCAAAMMTEPENVMQLFELRQKN